MAETIQQRRRRLNKESIALRKHIKKKRARLSKVRAALNRLRMQRDVQRGFDVSAHQGAVDFKRAQASGETWVGIKATEGQDFVDERFSEHFAKAKDTRLAIAAYAFGRPDTVGVADAARECEDFVNTVRKAGGKFISRRAWENGSDGVLGVLDFEVAPFSPSWAAAWARKYRSMTGVKPVIYGFGASLNPIANTIKAHFSGVWFAAYVEDWRPFCVDTLEPLVFQWQYTSSGTVPGVHGGVDRNRRV